MCQRCKCSAKLRSVVSSTQKRSSKHSANATSKLWRAADFARSQHTKLTMRIALIQMDSIVGDLVHNAASICRYALEASAKGAVIAITPELSLVGYPPRDVLLRGGFVDGCMDAAKALAKRLEREGAGGLAVVIGLPLPVPGGAPQITNGCAILRGGRIEQTYSKRLLPQYDVFDEARYFSPGAENAIIDVAGRRVGLLMCEDFWRGLDVGEGDGYSIDP
ncbi:MAG: hypothetical protein EXS15_05920, partial [Phycisphaerales bacterium]|nr:hypothetical protein [Phycisphaerales bacterium]